jgi:hypothetical protein
MAVFAFSGFASKPSTSELISCASGGHGDSSDNGVYSFSLAADSPAWVERCAPTLLESRVPNVEYQPDGKPTSRHTYSRQFYVPSIDKVIQVSATGLYGSGYDAQKTDGFSLTTNTWDPAGTYTNNPANGRGIAVDPTRNIIWTASMKRFDPSTNTYSSGTGTGSVQLRFPAVYYPVRDVIFSCQWGDGWTDASASGGLNACIISNATNPVQTAITFNSSAAYTTFVSEAANGLCAGMTYDSANGVFYWYSGIQSSNLYKIIPNNTSVWDMEIFQYAAGSASMPTVFASGFNGRIHYFPNLKGIALYPTGGSGVSQAQSIYFIKTSN